LCDRRRKAARADRQDLETVDRDQFAFELAEIDMEIAHRGAVDDAQQNEPARPDFNHLGIGKGAEVGEEGVIFNVVEVGSRGAVRRRHVRHCARLRHRGRRAARRRHSGHGLGVLQRGENLLGRREAEIGQHDHDLLLAGTVALIADDERRGHQELLLQALVRVHPERAAEAQREVVVRAAARRNWRT
jgi:hypothetical protein